MGARGASASGRSMSGDRRPRRDAAGRSAARHRAARRASSAPSFDGQGNVILVPKRRHGARAQVDHAQHESVLRGAGPASSGSTPKQMRWWERERRICQVVKSSGRTGGACSSRTCTRRAPSDTRLADAELRRATNFVDRQAEIEEVVIVAGDFNVTQAQSETIAALLERAAGVTLVGRRARDRPRARARRRRVGGARVARRRAPLRRQAALGPRAGRGRASTC